MLVMEGLKLLVIGMGLVFLFLIILIFFIDIMARVLRSATLAEEKAIKDELERQKAKKAAKAKAHHSSDVTAVIAAAVAAFRAKG